jgi:hypothetical protein
MCAFQNALTQHQKQKLRVCTLNCAKIKKINMKAKLFQLKLQIEESHVKSSVHR